MRKLIILTLLITAFALLMGVSAVSASSYRLDWGRNYAAYFEDTNVLKCCDFMIDMSAPDHGRFLARYYIENSSGDDVTVRIKQPTQGRVDDAVVSIDGSEANVAVRHTYGNSYIDVENDAALISDDFAEDQFFSIDMPVYKRTYLVTELKSPSAVACFSYDGSKSRFCFCNCVRLSENRAEKKGYVKAFRGARLVVYEIGEPKQPGIEFFEDDYGGRIEGEAKLENTEQLTLREFIASFNDYEYVSEVDYYNAVLDGIRRDGNCYYAEDFILRDFTQWLCLDVPLSAFEQTYVDFSLDIFYSTTDTVEYVCQIMTYDSFIPQAFVTVKTPYDVVFTNGKKADCSGEMDEHVYCFSDDFTVHIDCGRVGASGFTIFALSFLARLVFLPLSLLIAFVITRRKVRTKSL